MSTLVSFKDYPYWPAETEDDVRRQLREITSVRKDDITQIGNLVNIFIQGRKVGKIPSASNDVTDGDKIGDYNVTDSYAYYLVESAGVGVWRRVAVTAW